ncbi:hypothetical protein [Streptomyces griseofuscus]
MIKPEIAMALSATVEREAGTRWRDVVKGWAVNTRAWFQATLLTGSDT